MAAVEISQHLVCIAHTEHRLGISFRVFALKRNRETRRLHPAWGRTVQSGCLISLTAMTLVTANPNPHL